MSSFVYKLKIFGSIISLVSVKVMNMLQSMEWSFERLLHNVAVFVNIGVINSNSNISIFHKAFAALPTIVIFPHLAAAPTFFRAKFRGINSVGIYPKLRFALFAYFLNHNYILYHSGVECQGEY